MSYNILVVLYLGTSATPARPPARLLTPPIIACSPLLRSAKTLYVLRMSLGPDTVGTYANFTKSRDVIYKLTPPLLLANDNRSVYSEVDETVKWMLTLPHVTDQLAGKTKLLTFLSNDGAPQAGKLAYRSAPASSVTITV
jgi:hypothetical protein